MVRVSEWWSGVVSCGGGGGGIMWLGWRSGGGVVEVWWRSGGIIAGERGGGFILIFLSYEQ